MPQKGLLLELEMTAMLVLIMRGITVITVIVSRRGTLEEKVIIADSFTGSKNMLINLAHFWNRFNFLIDAHSGVK